MDSPIASLKRLTIAAALTVAANIDGSASAASTQAAQAHFFPSRPHGAVLHQLTGILTEYGIGNDAGGFEVIAGKKKYEIYVSQGFRINGAPAPCGTIPGQGKLQDPFCKWHSNIVLGKTMVKTAYWLQSMPETSGIVMVANEFDTLATRKER
jgi:hypothetical protein